ncbi:hypothetical protein GIB67_037267 [Kingdonia uniflora]|uniref:Aldehyde dehydrogenase domain-containing protein n=1 Tax=Kingdonia uniflora TaxID=39325 RepID=A0A7J7MS64_9MAGN|nr:hypothetical protein GIB67_037267 [Kingdonia uniflora]
MFLTLLCLTKLTNDVKRLSLLYVLEAFLLPNKGRNAETKYADRAEDIESFENFSREELLMIISFSLLQSWDFSKIIELNFEQFGSMDDNNKAIGEVLPEPLGVVLILSSWNYPIYPLIRAIAAGNEVVLKPSELAPACSTLFANTIPSYMDDKAVMVVEGGASVGKQLLDRKWDKLFFTGSPRVGRIVMSATAKHLTPVTLELGGKCPVIADSHLRGKWGFCSGQACIGVDYLLVEDKFAPSLIELMKKTIKRFHGDNPKESKNMAGIVNNHHFERLSGLLQDPVVAASIVHGGSLNEEKISPIEPTISLDPPLDAEIMTEEIFGPSDVALFPNAVVQQSAYMQQHQHQYQQTQQMSTVYSFIGSIFDLHYGQKWQNWGLFSPNGNCNLTNSLAVRYNNLSHLSLNFCTATSLSINSYQIAKQSMEMILRELEKVSEEEDMSTVPEFDIDHITNLHFPLDIGNNIGSSDHLLSEEDQPLSSADQVALHNAGVVDKRTNFRLRL